LKKFGIGTFVAGIIIIATGVSLAAEQGRGHARGRDNRPFETAPGQQRKVVSVPEPATLTLLGAAVGSGLLAGAWTRRRKRPR